jgi:hypothetical protein
MTYRSDGWLLIDRCPRCRRTDYMPLADLMARCHRCRIEYRRRWVREEDVAAAAGTALKRSDARRGAA